jgi:hypothetical protein
VLITRYKRRWRFGPAMTHLRLSARLPLSARVPRHRPTDPADRKNHELQTIPHIQCWEKMVNPVVSKPEFWKNVDGPRLTSGMPSIKIRIAGLSVDEFRRV